MSFYRIYRPQIIQEIDNPMVVEKLSSLLSKDLADLPHAYLFSGPKGTGKTTAARILAKIFNCKKPTKKGPCGKCDQCQAIANGTNLDILEIDAASNRGIDEIRELRDRINLAPAAAKYKIYIIDEVHMLTTEAFNALLKTLEEPPRHAIFILATTDPQKVPGTIKSRCIQVNFNKAMPNEVISALERVIKGEKLKIADEELVLIAGLADGSFRDAVKMLEQVSLHGSHISRENIFKYLPITESDEEAKFIAALHQKNAPEGLRRIQSMVKEGKDLKFFISSVLNTFHNELMKLIMDPTAQDKWSLSDVRLLIRLFTNAYFDMRISPIPQLPLELAVVEFCQSQAASPEPLPSAGAKAEVPTDGFLTLEKLTEHWSDFIESLKPFNHSVAGVLRSARPKTITRGIVTIEAFYKFHQEKLSEIKTREMLSEVLRKLFGEKVKVEIVLGKK